jgi:hypothetical protein
MGPTQLSTTVDRLDLACPSGHFSLSCSHTGRVSQRIQQAPTERRTHISTACRSVHTRKFPIAPRFSCVPHIPPHPGKAHVQCHRPSFPLPMCSHPKLTALVCVPTVAMLLRPCRRCIIHAVPIPTGAAIVLSPTCPFLSTRRQGEIYSIPQSRLLLRPSSVSSSSRGLCYVPLHHRRALAIEHDPPPAARPSSPPPQHWRPT